MKSIRKNLIAKAGDVTDDSLTAYASVELVDLEGDIVRIDGIDLSCHRPDSPLKIFPDHNYALENSGMPCVIGRVESLQKTTYKDTTIPALKFTMSWAKNADGSLTELAKAYKELYQSGYLDSFSVGLDRGDGEKLENGVDWTSTTLIEISAASIPANKWANVCKTLARHNIQVKNMADENVPVDESKDATTLNPIGVEGEGFTRKDMDNMMQCHKKDMSDMMTMHKKDMVDAMTMHFKDLNDRLDDIESAVSVGDDGPAPVTESQKALKALEAKKAAEIKTITEELAAIRKSIGK